MRLDHFLVLVDFLRGQVVLPYPPGVIASQLFQQNRQRIYVIVSGKMVEMVGMSVMTGGMVVEPG